MMFSLKGGVKRVGRQKKPPFILMSNYSSTQSFGDQVGIITARCMVMNINGIPLFHFIDHIKEIHNLPAIVNNNMQILENLIEINYYSLSNHKIHYKHQP